MNGRLDRRGVLTGVTASTAALALPGLALGQSRLPLLSAKGPGRPLHHHWSTCVGAGRANEGLRAAWLEQLQQAKAACQFRYCRFHGLFHDDMFVYREADGQPVYNWQYVDELFDRMLAIGVRPFVELGFMPGALASTERTQFWWKGNISPPRDMAKWVGLVDAFARHVIARYGLDEVSTWYFEVWNEPNLRVFWDGTRSQYFELYRHSVQALKRVSPRLRVGGPATSNFVGDERFDGDVEDKAAQRTNSVDDIDALPWHGVWIEAFLAFCAREGLPVDFVSAHPYPTDFALSPDTGRNKGRTRSRDATLHDLRWIRRAVGSSAFPHAEIHLTEWSSSPSSRDHTHDYLQAAAFVAKTNLDCAGLVQSLSYWTFTDVFEEQGAGAEPFHGGFGLINYQGIVKPAFHGYRMLAALGDELLDWRDGIAVTRHRQTGKLAILVIHYPDEVTTALSFGDRAQAERMLATGHPRTFSFAIDKLPPQSRFTVETLDRDHGNAVGLWQAMGSPPTLDRAQATNLRAGALALGRGEAKADAHGTLNWQATLAPWSCSLITQR